MLLTENCFNGNRKLSMRSGRAGPSFSVRPEKEAKGAVKSTALRQREALMHVETCSARRPKTRRLTALKQFGRSFDRYHATHA